jgi:nucleotide-binding universal stress UspA family protein
MKAYKNVVIDVSLDPDMMEQLLSLKDSPILCCVENVHLINIYNKKEEKYLPFSIKNFDDLDEVETFVKAELEKLSKRYEFKPEVKIHIHPLLSNDAKLDTVKYLENCSADLVITATHGKTQVEGLFRDSFNSYLLENSPCDIYSVRPVH